MKTLMNCDDAFEALTAGPVELCAEASRELVDHLAACDSCNVLAEALRPATHLLHESLPHQEQCGLPLVLAEDDAAVIKVMDKVHAADRSTTKKYLRPVTAAGFATIAAALLVLMGPWWPQNDVSSKDFRQQLSGLGIPDACFRTVDLGDPSLIRKSGNCENCHDGQSVHPEPTPCSLTLVCCTTCHAAVQQQRAPRVKIPRLVAACRTCHVPTR